MKCVFFVGVLAMSFVLAGIATAGVQINEVGVYTDPGVSASQIELADVTLFDAYLVLFDPHLSNGTPVGEIWGFECTITTTLLLFLVDAELPDQMLNFGENPGEFVVAGNAPVPVAPGGSAVLLTLQFLYGAADAQFVYLNPPSPTYADIPGQMCFFTMADAQLPHVMYPNSGSFEAPTFAVNGAVVPTEHTSWGDLKALYH